VGDSCRATSSHRLNVYGMVIVRVGYEYGHTGESGRVCIEMFDAGRVGVRVSSSVMGTGRVAEMVYPDTASHYKVVLLFLLFIILITFKFIVEVCSF